MWLLKLNALTEQMYIDEVDMDEEGMAEMLMDENSIADIPSMASYSYFCCTVYMYVICCTYECVRTSTLTYYYYLILFEHCLL